MSASAAPESVAKAGLTARQARLPWTEKYRPSTLDDVVAHEEILGTLRRLMSNDSMPHLLFYGPPGTGKTTTIRACAHHLYGKDRVRANVLEMNASDDRGIDVVRNQVREFASTSSIFSLIGSSSSSATGGGSSGGRGGGAASGSHTPFKLVVLDEADQMSHDAQAALRRVIEKYTKNVRFCILCNHINKIIPALQSRCTRFRFAPVRKVAVLPRLRHVAESEGVAFTPDGLSAVYRLCNGDLRRCLNTMQSAALSLDTITEESVYKVTGNPTPKEVAAIVTDMLGGDFSTSWAKVDAAVTDKGIAVTDLVREIHPVMMAMDLPQDCGAKESVGVGGILGAFQLVKEAVTQRKPIAVLAPEHVN